MTAKNMNLKVLNDFAKQDRSIQTEFPNENLIEFKPDRPRLTWNEFTRIIWGWKFYRNDKEIHNYILYWQGYDPYKLVGMKYKGIRMKARTYSDIE